MTVAPRAETRPLTNGRVQWSEEAEAYVVGCLFLGDQETARRVVDLVPVDAIHKRAHRYFLRAARRIIERGESVDVVTMSDELRSAGRLKQVGGMSAVAELSAAAPGAEGLEGWVATIERKAAVREMLEAMAEESGTLSETPAGEVPEALDRLEKHLQDIRDVRVTPDPEDEERRIYTLRELQEDPDLIREPEPLVTGVLYPGFATMIAGREKLGKSTVAFAAVAAVCREEDPFAQDDR